MKLALELWSEIASQVETSDLSSLALASSVQLHATRPELFRQIHLRYDDEDDDALSKSHRSIVNLLSENDMALARSVESLTLTGRKVSSSRNKHIFLPLDILSSMSNLRKLRFLGASPFHSESHQLEFVIVLNIHCPVLKIVEFEKSDDPGMDIPFSVEGVEWVAFYNLIAGTLQSATPFSSKTCLSLLYSSLNTLTNLILPSPISLPEAAHFVNFSESLQFPALQTFVLGPWLDEGTHEATEALTVFLRNHPTIRNLSLGWDPTTEYCANFTWTDKNFPPSEQHNFLPNLRCFSALISQTQVIAEEIPPCLFDLEEFRICTGYDDGGPIDMPSHLMRVGGLPEVKRLVYISKIGMLSVGGFSECMDLFAYTLEALETWEGDLPKGMTDKHLVKVFSGFKNIRQVTITSWGTMINDPDEAYMLATARKLAFTCKTLEKFGSVFSENPNRRSRTIGMVNIDRDDKKPKLTFELVENQKKCWEWP